MKTKKSIERQHKQVKQRNTHQAKTDETQYKTRPKKTGQKLKQAQKSQKQKQEFRFSRKNR